LSAIELNRTYHTAKSHDVRAGGTAFEGNCTGHVCWSVTSVVCRRFLDVWI